MAASEGEQRRQYFRLRYPKSARPVIRVEDKTFSVCESSEGGLRVLMGQVASLYCGLRMSATVSLHNESDVDIEGSILRFDDNEVVIKLDKGLSFKDMVAEQRYVKQKFPNFLSGQRQNIQFAG
ncbi:PilZ domain-containing protein [Vibrio sp.]|nr:PilZ domain-containing protein [Vibrio sp.]